MERRLKGDRALTRVAVHRIGVVLLALLAFGLLWSMAYEVTVGLRWAPSRFPIEGASRWALLRMQNADRSPGFFLIAWDHFWVRLFFPTTRLEASARAGIAAGAVTALGFGGALFVFVNRQQMPFGAARFGTLMEAAKQGLTGKRGIVLGR